jgi:hypothetical protein
MNAKYLLLYLWLIPSLLFGNDPWTTKLGSMAPEWMKQCIENDFHLYTKSTISRSQLDQFFEKYSGELHLVRFTLNNNRLYIDKKFQDKNADVRIALFRFALEKMAEEVFLPNISFIISMHDGIRTKQNLPIFVMAKLASAKNLLLVPDFDARV